MPDLPSSSSERADRCGSFATYQTSSSALEAFTTALTSWRASRSSRVQHPVVKRPLPRPVGAPGLFPPCIRQRFRPFTAGDKHGVAFRVFAPHREACCSRNVDEEYGDRLWRPDSTRSARCRTAQLRTHANAPLIPQPLIRDQQRVHHSEADLGEERSAVDGAGGARIRDMRRKGVELLSLGQLAGVEGEVRQEHEGRGLHVAGNRDPNTVTGYGAPIYAESAMPEGLTANAPRTPR